MGIRNCKELGINLQKIVRQLLANQNLCKLLYYADNDPLNQPDIEKTNSLYNSHISVIPKYNPVETDKSVVNVVLHQGMRDGENDEFRNFLIRCYVYVPNTNWIIRDENLRPFAIIGEIENSLSGKNINGLGKLQAGDIAINMITEQMTTYYIDFYLTAFL